MKRQNVKEKDLFNMCTGLKYQKMRVGDWAAIYGDNSQANRKLMILFEGTLSLRIPTPPDVMIKHIDDLLAQ